MRSPSPASGLCGSALAISPRTHTPVTPILLLYRIDTAVWPFVQKNSMFFQSARRAIRIAYGNLVSSCGGFGRPQLGLLRCSWIRREKSAETLEEWVAVELQPARPEVFATARYRESPPIERENPAVPAPSAVARRGSESPVRQPVPGYALNS